MKVADTARDELGILGTKIKYGDKLLGLRGGLVALRCALLVALRCALLVALPTALAVVLKMTLILAVLTITLILVVLIVLKRRHVHHSVFWSCSRMNESVPMCNLALQAIWLDGGWCLKAF